MIEGGHALMLRVEPSTTLINVTKKWVDRDPLQRENTLHKAHTTLAFIGRNLDEEVGEQIKKIACEMADELPKTVTFSGKFAMFGRNKDHLVALLKPEEDFYMFRGRCLEMLKEAGIRIEKEYIPHLTLAKGRHRDYVLNSVLKPFPLEIKALQVKVGSEYFEFPHEMEQDISDELMEEEDEEDHDEE